MVACNNNDDSCMCTHDDIRQQRRRLVIFILFNSYIYTRSHIGSRRRESRHPKVLTSNSMTTSSSSTDVCPSCTVCAWRRCLIKKLDEDDNYTDAPPWACDSADPVILQGLHQQPSQVWIDIIVTDKLCSPQLPVLREGRLWVSIPLRCDPNVDIAPRMLGE